MSMITCDNVSFSYEGRQVVTEVSFEVNEGDYLCIVGENGAGKSTLMKGLLHLKPPSSGRILLGDGLKQEEIGYLPQQTVTQRDFPASVHEVVLSGCLNRMGRRFFYSGEMKDRALKQMRRLGIEELRNRCYRDLSGGQQQRVLLARALCATRRLLILDEPVTGLDPVIASDFYRLIRRLHEEYHITVIMVSHDIQGAVREADHILHVANRQKFFGEKSAYRNSPVGRAFLEQSMGGEVK